MAFEIDVDADTQASIMFLDGTCLVCGHLKGDHEGPYDGKWYCDDDWCEDNDTCSPPDL